jgi:hypothetical protein
MNGKNSKARKFLETTSKGAGLLGRDIDRRGMSMEGTGTNGE